MTNNNHPITPPDDLQEQWKQEWLSVRPAMTPCIQWMLAKSSRWGYEQRAANNEDELQKARDEELEACCEWLDDFLWVVQPNHQVHPMAPKGAQLRKHRRPKPPSLKEQALGLLNEGPASDLLDHEVAVIRRALESLPD